MISVKLRMVKNHYALTEKTFKFKDSMALLERIRNITFTKTLISTTKITNLTV